ncbi:MAG: Anti-sigma regulatory factor (Ser/Thr protein kinase), partial [Actinomycetia bacterium]|nr:Anti-sigma regulatory factor (Ser/Thr protein kinase) [Actinomycetes bacterium]
MSITELDRSFHHEAFVYDSDEGYVAGLVPYLEAGLRAGEEVIVVVPSRQAALLRAALGGPAAGRVTF